ncbi:hypothetical protein GCM10009868_08710 [Terrabacter aerolatus]|uniref:Type II secretion system protein GspF domain-containing protein n=1 Tax=Terrabacter aerolatus TaxID=422442 RepID=A0A512D4F6_9MICO|nr:conjugal transfer protein TraD [Terrabacter aerolatus]GEO31355.1 hypothetical protein TAE01_31650 [Terrabacter aerolatus]
MSVGEVIGAVFVGVAVLLWPGRASVCSPIAGLRPGDVLSEVSTGVPRGHVSDEVPSTTASGAPASLWRQDPVDLYRQWRLRRRPGDLVDDVLDLLRGIGPALAAGLTPARAIELAATSTLGAARVVEARASMAGSSRRRHAHHESGRRRRHGGRSSGGRLRGTPPPGTTESERGGLVAASSLPRADIDRLVGALIEASDLAEPTSSVWAAWAERSATAELSLVAAAWRLSETTGAPLASAVDRAVRGLLDARSRRGKVAVAVAGPRATVTVLTLLPLTGPLFGLACGIDPASLYLASPIATACAVLGLLLVWVGRAWCTRMVRKAVRP